ncbi:Putative nudix hydrolase 7 [Cytospora mali]|uniref:Nudix hydrolase 7 n=1 Tax=Cytospora mali TaxID=578113 RepID=A0A194W3J5_CYTMA|nr:Putative nudix hydrolase 7 [Valsa mali]
MSQPKPQTRLSSSTSPSPATQRPPVSEARPSSSIILLSPTNQVLLLHRVHTSTSFPSAHVFPGGNLSPFHEPPLLPQDHHRDSLAYRLAAIRETFEESGILLARPKQSPHHDNDNNNTTTTTTTTLLAVPESDRDKARGDIHNDRLNFSEWVGVHLGGTLCVDDLVPFTRWVTPPNMPKRFTTQMYLFFMPLASAPRESGAVVDVDVVQTPTSDGGVEHTAATFADADEWLRKQDRGEIVLFPPQCYLLTLVAEMLNSVPVREGGGEDGLARYAAQRKALIDFVKRTPTGGGGEKKPHLTTLIPWSEKVMSPQTLFIRSNDGRIVLGVDKPGPELKGTGRGGDFERVVLVNFTKQGPKGVEVRHREDILREEREAKEKKKAAAKL